MRGSVGHPSFPSELTNEIPELGAATPGGTVARSNAAVGLKAYLDDIAAMVKRVPPAWVRCELHALTVGDRFVRMEFIELDRDGKQIAKVQGGCWPSVWRRIEDDFKAAGLRLEHGSQVLVQIRGNLNPTFGFQVEVTDFDLTFALGDLSTRLQAIRKALQDSGIWGANRSLPRPNDFTRVSVIAPAGAAALGDFRSTASTLEAAGLVHFEYHEVPFQTREAPARIIDALRVVYRSAALNGKRSCAVAIVRGGGASADLAWLVDQKLAEAVCRMNVPVLTGIGHERDRNLLDEISCIAFDTPSKVIEHIASTVAHAALQGSRAYDAIKAVASQIASSAAATTDALRAAADRDARESLRAAENSVRTAAAALEPDARHALETSRDAVTAHIVATGRDSRESLREADKAVRIVATGLEPGARAHLDQAMSNVLRQAGASVSNANARREEAAESISRLRGDLTRSIEASSRTAELSVQRTHGEMLTRIEGMPAMVQDAVGSVRRSILRDAALVVEVAIDRTRDARSRAIEDALRSLETGEAGIATARERADALHPRNILAAGYSILRDGDGAPLTGVEAVRAASAVTAELRDGEVPLVNGTGEG